LPVPTLLPLSFPEAGLGLTVPNRTVMVQGYVPLKLKFKVVALPEVMVDWPGVNELMLQGGGPARLMVKVKYLGS